MLCPAFRFRVVWVKVSDTNGAHLVFVLQNTACEGVTTRCLSEGVRAEGPADFPAQAAGLGKRVELPIRAAGPADCSPWVAIGGLSALANSAQLNVPGLRPGLRNGPGLRP